MDIPTKDRKTYTTKEAKAEWDRTSIGRRRMLLARVDLRDSDMAKKDWDSFDTQERKLAHRALNEDFFGPSWYINKKGIRIDLLAEILRSQAELDWEEGQAYWDNLQHHSRYSALLANGICDDDSSEGMFSSWECLSPELRGRLLAQFRAADSSREHVARPVRSVRTKPVDPKQMELF